MRRGILFFIFSLAGALIFFAGAFFACASVDVSDGTHYSSSTPVTWKTSDSPILVHGEITIDSNAKLVIEPGVVVKFEYEKGKINVFGQLSAIGTKNQKIIFTSSRDDESGGDTDNEDYSAAKGDWQDLNLSGIKEIRLDYAKIMYAGGGRADDAITINNNDQVSITNSEIRNNQYTGLKIINSLPKIENNIIAENFTGIYFSSSAKTLQVQNNSVIGNKFWGMSVINSAGNLVGHIDAKENWWGSDSGPKLWNNSGGSGDKISQNILFDPWLQKDPNAEPEQEPDPGPDPVIIIPGIMGSWQKDGVWQIDPIFHTYDNLCEEFLANGYENGKNFFVFPYEWRDSNIDNAKKLANLIGQIKTDTGRQKVDIVAHSMGGLLAREYIESDYYADDVDQLITLGTPQLGAPKDYITWEGGEFLGLWSPLLKRIVTLEALENGYSDIFSYIHKRPMKSVEELLPTYNYLYDEIGGENILRATYPTNYPRNVFLEKLNDPSNLEQLKNIEFIKIIGKLNNENITLSGFNVVPKFGDLWMDGIPKWFGVLVLEELGRRTSDGDETVPLYSAEASEISDAKTIHLQSEHNNLPTDAQKEILEILTGKIPEQEISHGLIHNMLIVAVHSPVDIEVESPIGKKIGKNFVTNGNYDEIEGGYYTGFDTKTEFITIPKPENGEYKITVQGVGNGGAYEIETTRISDSSENAEESGATDRGIVQAGQIRETKVDIVEGQIVAIDIQTIRRNVEYYAKFGYIKNAEVADYYFARLRLLEKLIDRLNEDKKDNKSIVKIQDEINSHIDHLIEHIQKSDSSGIDQKAAEFFVEDLEDLRNMLINNS